MSAIFTALSPPMLGTHLLQPNRFCDSRGEFIKTFHSTAWRELGVEFEPREEYISISRRNVIRGMHFQLPPADHVKFVYCIRGRVNDVLLDLRRNSPTYGHASSVELTAHNRRLLVIPSGVAHGFLSREDDSVMVYKTTTEHSPTHDAGIRWDSFGFNWNITDPIVSGRDADLPLLKDFSSPF